ncbi:hypothetical protein T069G_01397 [Trichoderma breve]|uniref:Uncharacterized protein n=1 Tax=Trichoderma breve TaxID=2034170 RepID=A0A9W9EDN6_9HYPO|nr:hypothetical protein T069G_01397 [Trichoderma breve]KAJ4864867.1 hypothetical protein T069G_01397 [Trichoderma breve]
MSSEYPYPRPHRLDLDNIKISITHESYTIALQTVDYYHRQAITMTPDEQEKYVEMYKRVVENHGDLDTGGQVGVVPRDTRRILKDNDTTWVPASGWEQPDDPDDTPDKRKDKEDDNRRPKKLKVTTSRFRLPDDDYGEDPSPTWFAATPLPNNPTGTGESRTNKIETKIAALELELQTERELR